VGKAAADIYDKAKATPKRNYGIFDLLKVLKESAIQKDSEHCD